MRTDRSHRIRWKGSAALAALASIALVAVAWTAPRFRDRAAQVFVIFVGALVIRLLVRAVGVATSSPGPFAFDRALAPAREHHVAWATEPERIEYEVGTATHRAMELHHQFRRRLRALARDRLAAQETQRRSDIIHSLIAPRPPSRSSAA